MKRLTLFVLLLALAMPRAAKAQTGNISFSDANVKAICVQYWDSNHDGELSYSEAAAVTSLGTRFQGKQNISHFHEFQYFTNVTSLVTDNDYGTFHGCSSLIALTLPNSLTNIGKWAFCNCHNLIMIEIPSAVTIIDEEAFMDCWELRSVTYRNGVNNSVLNTIGQGAFRRCFDLLTFSIPNNVEEINANTFNGCSVMYTIDNIPPYLYYIGDNAFYGCSFLHEMNIPYVETVGNEAFFGCTELTTVYIPNVTSIGSQAFYNCSNLTTVGFTTHLTSIGDGAFQSCSSLQTLSIPSSVTSIGASVFQSCTNLSSVTIPYSVTSIGESAFRSCTRLSSLTIPNSVTTIGQYAFAGCSRLTSVAIPNSMTAIPSHAFDGCSGLSEVLFLGNTQTSIGEYAFSGCSGLTSVTIPSSMTTIYNNAFADCSNLTSVTIYSNAVASATYEYNNNLRTRFGNQVTRYSFNGNVTAIGKDAFYNCTGMTSVNIPESVTSIGFNAFCGCSGLTSVTIPNSVTSIEEYAFDRCSGLTQANYTGTLGEWCNISFSNKYSNPLYFAHNLYIDNELVTTPNFTTNGTNVTSINPYAFAGCTGLNSVNISSFVTYIGNFAFDGCTALTSVTIRSNDVLTATFSDSYNLGTIFGTQVESYTINGYGTTIVTSIGKRAFSDCTGMTSLTMGTLTDVTSIGNYAFYNCSSLTSFTIPYSYTSTTSIGNSAFENCSGLQSINCGPDIPPTLGTNVFQGVDPTIPVNVPCNAKAAYQAANGWSDFTNIVDPCEAIVFADPAVKAICVQYWDTNHDGELSYPEAAAVTSLGNVFHDKPISSFDELQYFTSLTSLDYVNDYGAFEGCSGLSSIVLPASLTSIGNKAFYGCESLTSIVIPNSVTSIGDYAFSESGMTQVTIPDSVTSIGNYAFYWCGSLTSIEIPNSVTSIGNYMFYNCSSLSSIEIPNSVTSIGNNAFYGCSGLTSLSIPNSVASIGQNAFVDCYGLTSIVVATGNATYDSRNNCNAIIETNTNTLVVGCQSTVIPNTVTSIGNAAFNGCQSLTSIVIPNSVTSIGNSAFSYCSGMTSVTIGSSVATIGNSAFSDCDGLTSLTVQATTPPSLGSYTFQNVPHNIPVYVPFGSLAAYQNYNNTSQPWGGFSNIQCDDCTAELPLSENFDSYPGVTSGSVNVLPDCWSRINTTTVSSQQGYPTITEYSYAQSAPNFLYFMSSYVVGSYEDTQDQYAILPSVDNVSNLVLSLSARIPAGGRNGTFMVGVMTDPTDASTFTPLATFAPTTTTYQQYTVAFNSYSGEGHYIAIKMPAASSDVYYRGLCIDDVTLDIVSSPNIVFADAAVKALCVANWDTNGDGELSYDEAALVTVLGDVFYGEAITSFNELQYFTGLTAIDDEAFSGCYQLTSVIIPNGVTAIGSEAFYDCSSLTSVTIPNSVTTIYSGAFYYCSSLTSVTIPSSVTDIGSDAFSDCSSLISITIPSSVTTIGDAAFYNCSALANIVVEAGNTVYDSRDNCNAIIETATNTLMTGCQNTIIPNTVTIIGQSSFSGCTNLTSIAIPNGVTTIGESAFNASGLTEITLPNTVTAIGDGAFSYCSSVTSAILPSGLTSINNHTFSYCTSLQSITIPSSVTSIGNNAFYNCSGLTSITVEATTPPTLGTNAFRNVPTSIPVYVPCGTQTAYQAAAGWNAFTNIVDPCEAIVFADPAVKALCVANWDTNGDGELSYPEAAAVTTLKPDGVTYSVFYDNSSIETFDELQYFTGLSTIETRAFYSCSNLTSVTLPDNVTSIGSQAFSYSGLQSITLPEGLTTINAQAFGYCNLTSIHLPSSVRTLGTPNPFVNCSAFGSITVDENNPTYDSRDNCNAIIKTTGNQLVVGCKNTVIPSSVTSIGQYAFYGQSELTSIAIPNSVTTIGQYAFYGCTSLPSITLPETITSIDNGVFSQCTGLQSITLPASITNININAFYNCTGLLSITLPASITNISSTAFYSCTGLQSITVEATTPPTIYLNTFSYVPTDIPVNVPCGTKAAYQAAAGWNAFTNFVDPCDVIVFADPAVKALCVANWDSNSDGELSYPEAAEVTSLGGVFQGNAEITSFDELQYFTSVTVIQVSAFSGCSGLESVTLPDALTTIGSNAFRDCSSLESITLPNSLTTILDYAFYGCSSLTTIEIPNTVNSLGRYVFSQCTGLTSVTLPNVVTSIKASLFEGCSSLTSIIIPDAVTSIENAAFRDCSSLTSIEIPNAVTSIGSQAFNSCTNLQSITCLPTTPPTLVTHAFSSATYNSATLTVPCGSISAYQSASYWSNFTHIVGGCEQATALEAGWNWWAPTVEMSMEDFEAALVGISGDILINSQDEGFARRTGGTWDGTLTSIELGKMYKIKTTAGATLTMAGDRPATVTVTILPGYTWFGYTGAQAADITTALGNLGITPASGDTITDKNGNTATYNGSSWSGDLITLQPGHGYIYLRQQ